ncbi:MAG: S-layer homology domain-containing protein, partial [Bacillota bacterium]|nr:S-layer homology domain-containing protein [Bacillota bacterium]
MKNVFKGIRYRILKSIRAVSCIVFALMMVVCAAAATPNPVFAAGYTDIEGHWAEKIINRVTDLGLFVGGGNNQFFPQRETTRAEFITVMTRALNPEVDNTSNETSYWAFKYLKFAKEKGYIPADYDISEEYCSQTMSRLEMIRLLALMIEKLEVPHDVTPPDLTDTDGLDEADIKIIHFVMTTGVIKGHNNQVMPYKTTSRAELATVILNMHDKAP